MRVGNKRGISQEEERREKKGEERDREDKKRGRGEGKRKEREVIDTEKRGSERQTEERTVPVFTVNEWVCSDLLSEGTCDLMLNVSTAVSDYEISVRLDSDVFTLSKQR